MCLCPLQLRHPRCPWDLEHLLQFQWSSKVVLATATGVELKGGLFKVRMARQQPGNGEEEEEEVVL